MKKEEFISKKKTWKKKKRNNKTGINTRVQVLVIRILSELGKGIIDEHRRNFYKDLKI